MSDSKKDRRDHRDNRFSDKGNSKKIHIKGRRWDGDGDGDGDEDAITAEKFDWKKFVK